MPGGIEQQAVGAFRQKEKESAVGTPRRTAVTLTLLCRLSFCLWWLLPNLQYSLCFLFSSVAGTATVISATNWLKAVKSTRGDCF